MEKLEKTIIERVKEKLNITYDLKALELYKLLYKTRNESHPDKFDKTLNELATSKFTELTTLLTELKLYIDNEKLNLSSNELILYQENYEEVLYKNKVLILEGDIINLNEQLTFKQNEIENLQKRINILIDEDLEKKEDQLKIIYKPKKNNLVVLGITATLIVSINILVHITNLKDKFTNLFSFNIDLVNSFFLILYLFIIIKILLNNLHLNKVDRIKEDLKTNRKIQFFLNDYVKFKKKNYSEEYTKDYFTEYEVEEFILDTYFKKNNFIKLNFINNLYDKWKYPNRFRNINYLKDIFIYNLISKDLVSISSAKSLNREFRIK
ncbi:hypothetical protein [Myroides odoratimimus]|uniref:hypothetical protein n=1 Tax=Myroides odoratimimus TaxID=76832 RepID=UPI003100F1B8